MEINDIPRPILRSIQGLVLSVGSPLGWLIIRLIEGYSLMDELKQQHYLYMLVMTAIVFTAFGYFVGRSEQKLGDLSLQDGLTGLYNKRYFHDRLHEACSESIRHKTPLSLIQLDIDHFKSINDCYGHLAGDAVLTQISQCMKDCSRVGETISRVGGEEFSIILVDCNQEQALVAAHRFHQAIKTLKICISDNVNLSVTVSIGVACSDDFDCDEWALYKMADDAMYKAKQDGRDQVFCYH